MASGDFLQDRQMAKLGAYATVEEGLSGKLRAFWISKGFADGDPGTEAKYTWYAANGGLPVGGGFNEIEFYYWDVVAP